MKQILWVMLATIVLAGCKDRVIWNDNGKVEEATENREVWDSHGKMQNGVREIWLNKDVEKVIK